MSVSEIRSSGILKKDEDATEIISGSMIGQPTGILVITNKRFLFVRKAGMFSKGLNLIFSCSLGDIMSISTKGILSNKIDLTVNINGKTRLRTLLCREAEVFAKKILYAKENFAEEKTIEAKNIIITGGSKDKALDILKKRLARGEITLEEFHQLVQRL